MVPSRAELSECPNCFMRVSRRLAPAQRYLAWPDFVFLGVLHRLYTLKNGLSFGGPDFKV